MAMGKLVQVTKTVTRGRRRRVRKNVRASKALKTVIQKEINKNIEDKYDFSTAFSQTLDATAENCTLVGLFAPIVQGITNTTRIGNEINVRSVKCTFRATAFSSVATGTVYLVKFKSCDGTNPVIGDIWRDISDIGVSDREPDFMDDYQILDKVVIQANKGVSLNNVYTLSKTFKGKGLKVRYDATAGLITDVEENNLFVIAQSHGSDDIITVAGVWRIKYQDA